MREYIREILLFLFKFAFPESRVMVRTSIFRFILFIVTVTKKF